MAEAVVAQERSVACVHQEKTRIGAGDADLGTIARVAVEFAESGVIDVAGTARVLDVLGVLHGPQLVAVAVVEFVARQYFVAAIAVDIAEPHVHTVPGAVGVGAPAQLQIFVVGPERITCTGAIAVSQDQVLCFFGAANFTGPQRLQRVQIVFYAGIAVAAVGAAVR